MKQMTNGRNRHTATLLIDGTVLVTGGDNSGAQSSSEIYTSSTNLWSSVGNLNTARCDHAATLLNTGKVLVAGGRGVSVLSSAELYVGQCMDADWLHVHRARGTHDDVASQRKCAGLRRQ